MSAAGTALAVLDDLLADSGRDLGRGDEEGHLLPALKALTEHHLAACPAYARLVGLTAPGWREADDLAGLPWLPVGLFKSHRLASVPDDAITGWVTSSGTTGQTVSRVPLDAEAARRQARALAATLRPVLGPERLPMVVVDARETLAADAISARAAGILGMMKLGRNHLFCLDAAMRLDVAALADFLDRHGRRPFLVFGFTFMVWRHFRAALEGAGLDLSNAILVHSGGWKRLAEEAVDDAAFREGLRRCGGIRRVYDFYGMAEQIGTVHLQGEDGLLHPPAFAAVLVRDPVGGAVVPPGTPGLIQVLSLLPHSYPGHSLLTGDVGVVEGKGFRVLGRVPRAEPRGCSDVHAGAAA